MQTGMRDTLALIEIDNAEDIAADLHGASRALLFEQFAARVRRLARQRDEVVAVQPHRFCLKLQDVEDPQQIKLAGAKLERLFESPFQLPDEEVRARVRAAFVPPGLIGSEGKRMQVAEAALAEARAANVTFVIREDVANKTLQQASRRSREVEAAFEQGEFVMYFQPQIHASYRKVVAAEALMRWHSPEHGVRLPAEFIPYLRGERLQKDFTWFALKSALANVQSWPEGMGVAVNVPPLVLYDEELLSVVEDALAIYSVDAAMLTLEITEDAMIDNPEQALLNLATLRTLGVRVSIDDFGTGYSSLAYFRDLPADELKVDRTFVTSMLERPRDSDIVKAIIDLAHNFSLRVVAEGVEDSITADALQTLGCDLLQGFHFGRPAPGEIFAAGL